MCVVSDISSQRVNNKSGTQRDERVTLRLRTTLFAGSDKNVRTPISCYFVFETEIGCLCEQNGLSFLSQRLIVCNCFRESSLVCVERQMSDQANFTQTLDSGGVEFPDPISCCQNQKTQHFIYSVYFLSWSLSYSLCLCLILFSLLHYTSGIFLYSPPPSQKS